MPIATFRCGKVSYGIMEEVFYRPKDITSPQEAFAYLQNLIPSKANAFLFRDMK